MFLDTSVLVATFYGDHQHHDASMTLFRSLAPTSACTSAHCLAEVYAVLTGMPGKDRVSPDEALLFLADVRERLAVVALSAEDYVAVLSDAARFAVTGGGVCDALHSRCADNADATALYTWNVKHFVRFGVHAAERVRTP